MPTNALRPVDQPTEQDPPSAVGMPGRLERLKLVELALTRLMLAGAAVNRPFSTLLGFADPAVAEAVQAIFRACGVTGSTIAAVSSDFERPDHAASRLAAVMTLVTKVDAAARFDVLALDVGSLGIPCVDMLGGSLRPAVVYCCDVPATAEWAARKDALVDRGYLCGADLGRDVVFVHAKGFDRDPRPTVRSFDVFDTLIARRCIDPWRVFQMVGDRTGLSDFVEQRRAAEQRVIAGIYTFDDIYAELGRHYGLADADVEALKACEMACEVETTIPIAENLALVADGDLLLSDMYLNESQLRELLGKAGLRKSVGLLVSSHGKSGGLVWPKLQPHVAINCHLGDNPYADGVMADRAGLRHRITAVSEPNVVEAMLLQVGLADLARCCREARLATHHPDPAIRTLQVIQTSINFPMLLLASVHLARRAVAAGRRTLLFCSRDCNLWHPLFDQIGARMGTPFATHYYLTSRRARIEGSDAYRRYSAELLADAPMIVDLCGTGWSTAHLIAALGLGNCHTYLIDLHPPLAQYENRAPTPDSCVVHSLFGTSPGLDNTTLECANFAPSPMITDMCEIDGARLPVFAPDLRSTDDLAAVTAQGLAFGACTAAMRHYEFRQELSLDDASIELVCLSLYQYLSRQAAAFTGFAAGFHAENGAIVQRLCA